MLDTLVLVLVLKGGPTSLNLPRVHWSEMINSGGAASLGAVVDSFVIHLNTQALAGAVAGVHSGGLTVLLAQDGSSTGRGGPPCWNGSGPVSGVLAVNACSKSIRAIQEYRPQSGSIEFVFDPATNTFAVGKAPTGIGSPHQRLARAIDADPQTVVGGMFKRGLNGEIYTNENSGHYGRNWTPEIRKQFEQVMQEYGLPVNHLDDFSGFSG